MDCQKVQEAMSALIDGEAPGDGARELDEHLAVCASCSEWAERAHELTRRFRLQAQLAPGPPRELLDRLRRESQASKRRLAAMVVPRVALAVVSAGQLAVSVPMLLLGTDRSAPVHVAHEMGSLDVALAIGFLAAVRRPARAMGMVSLVGVAAGLLVLTAAVDLALGHTDLLDEAPHLLVVAGWLLLRRLATLAPPSRDRPLGLHAALATPLGVLSERLDRARGSTPAQTLPPRSAWPLPSRARGPGGLRQDQEPAGGPPTPVASSSGTR